MISCFCRDPGRVSSIPRGQRQGSGDAQNVEAGREAQDLINVHLAHPDFPNESLAKSSITGMNALHVGHQGAQAKTKAGSGDFKILVSKSPSVTRSGCGRKSSSIANSFLHFPQTGLDSIRSAGILFRAPHCMHRNLNASCPGFSSTGRGVPHFPHFALAPFFRGGRDSSPRIESRK